MKRFPAKILLFGEYTVLYNQKALAFPYPHFGGQWSFENTPEAIPSLLPWLTYIESLSKELDWIPNRSIQSFSLDLSLGIWFKSDIPIGYGLGSSGALTAAWYHRYIEENSTLSLNELQSRLAKLESFFHGTSSGFDPLVSYCDRAILLTGTNKRVIDFDKGHFALSKFFIIDTLKSRSTSPLVHYFRNQCKKDRFRKALLNPLIIVQEKAIKSLVSLLEEKKYRSKNQAAFEQAFYQISQLQIQYLGKLIPPSIQKIWKAGSSKGKYNLKICGAGGGGIILGLGELPQTTLPVARPFFH